MSGISYLQDLRRPQLIAFSVRCEFTAILDSVIELRYPYTDLVEWPTEETHHGSNRTDRAGSLRDRR
jgi:hypothetical protein